MTLNLNGIEVACVIGERPDERMRLQTLRIDAELEIPSAAASSDHLDETIDYAALTDEIRSSLVAAKCQMIERAAKISFDVCAAACRAIADARPLRVTVTKFGAIPGLASASVSYP
jgi:dihydroneopterin aldolase